MTPYNLFLDDLRQPVDAWLYEKGRSLFEGSGIVEWVIVRNYDDFVRVIQAFGMPDVISFDHDLHFEHIRHFCEVTCVTGVIEYGNFRHKTGKSCAEYVMNRIKAGDKKPAFYVHSANDEGRAEIWKVLNQ